MWAASPLVRTLPRLHTEGCNRVVCVFVVDGKVLTQDGQSHITKVAIEPVWYLPGIAERFGVSEQKLRETLFRETNLMYPELITRPDVKVTMT